MQVCGRTYSESAEAINPSEKNILVITRELSREEPDRLRPFKLDGLEKAIKKKKYDIGQIIGKMLDYIKP